MNQRYSGEELAEFESAIHQVVFEEGKVKKIGQRNERHVWATSFERHQKPFKQDINDERTKELPIDRILGCAKQRWNIQMLLDPAEKDLNLPSSLIHLCDLFRRDLH